MLNGYKAFLFQLLSYTKTEDNCSDWPIERLSMTANGKRELASHFTF